MAKLIVIIKHYVLDDNLKEFEVDVELRQMTPRQFIDEKISSGVLQPEGKYYTYVAIIIDKVRRVIKPQDFDKSFKQLGVEDEDTITIIRGFKGYTADSVENDLKELKAQETRTTQDGDHLQTYHRYNDVFVESGLRVPDTDNEEQIAYIPNPRFNYKTKGLITVAGGAIGQVGVGAAIGLGNLFSRKQKKIGPELYDVYSSIFAPSEVKRKSHMLVQVYLHLFEETDKVMALALESQKDAERRDYIPLQSKLKKGDKVDILLNIHGEILLSSEKKSIVWQGTFSKCSFDYFVPNDIEEDELSCMALLTVNDIPIGEMRFVTSIVDAPPKQLNTNIIARKYDKVFISYSHKDESKVKFLHEGLELGGVSHFFDRNYLKVGDVFPQVIQDYIDKADLFILCWSENASKSDYVKKELIQALERAFPQIPQQFARLSIYPINIEPRAELPNEMKEYYHFGEL